MEKTSAHQNYRGAIASLKDWTMTSTRPAHRQICIRLALASVCVAASLAIIQVNSAQAQDASYSITLRDGKFSPALVNVKAGVKFSLNITNATAKSAEFESYELSREKVVEPGKTVTVFLGPLEPGSYPFFDDFNQAAAGKIIAK